MRYLIELSNGKTATLEADRFKHLSSGVTFYQENKAIAFFNNIRMVLPVGDSPEAVDVAFREYGLSTSSS